MSERKQIIEPEDLSVIAAAKQRAIMVATHAEKVVAEAKVAELEHRSTILQLFIKYGLDASTRINEQTGEISYAEDQIEDGVMEEPPEEK